MKLAGEDLIGSRAEKVAAGEIARIVEYQRDVRAVVDVLLVAVPTAVGRFSDALPHAAVEDVVFVGDNPGRR
jgi:hypothetical protein